jgi:long-subunit fatty acid transport protein
MLPSQDEWHLMANADWEEWSEFSDNYLFVEGGVLDPAAALDRDWKDTWHAGIAASRYVGNKVYNMGFSYRTGLEFTARYIGVGWTQRGRGQKEIPITPDAPDVLDAKSYPARP